MEQNEWEFSKENVQPLRQGRKIANLEAALNHEYKLDQQRLAEQRQFELELRTYDGEDPLSVWYQYVLWGEQNFPKGGLKGNLSSLVEKCCSTFKDDERYKNDSRYFDVWLRSMNNCSEPLEVYNILYSNNMFTELANFYLNWALELEKNGHFKRADAVYMEGTNRNSKLAESLQKYHRQFLVRLNSRSQEQIENEEENYSTLRFPLTALKSHGEKNEVPFNRVDAYLIGRTRQNSTFQPVQKRSAFKIHNENEPTPLIIHSAEPSSAPIKPEAIKENTEKPGQWSRTKASRSKLKVIPISAVGQYAQPNFEVHNEGDDETLPKMTPKRIGLHESKLPLSEKKMERNNTTLRLEKNESTSKERYMYCHEKIYNGLQEFSFEELRLMCWQKSKKNLHQETT